MGIGGYIKWLMKNEKENNFCGKMLVRIKNNTIETTYGKKVGTAGHLAGSIHSPPPGVSEQPSTFNDLSMKTSCNIERNYSIFYFYQ